MYVRRYHGKKTNQTKHSHLANETQQISRENTPIGIESKTPNNESKNSKSQSGHSPAQLWFLLCPGGDINILTISYRHIQVYPGVGIGQSSSVMLLQKSHTTTTDKRVKKVSKSAPLTLPCVGLQMWTLITKLKICPIAKRRAAAVR